MIDVINEIILCFVTDFINANITIPLALKRINISNDIACEIESEKAFIKNTAIPAGISE